MYKFIQLFQESWRIFDAVVLFSVYLAKAFDTVITSSSMHKSIMFCGKKDLPWSKKLVSDYVWMILCLNPP